jgi:phosphatidylglycerol---prolipoprotein diacylglyceryl transferase
MVFLAHWLNDLDPVAVSLGGLQIRWYGIAYVLGFAGAFWLLRTLIRRGLGVIPEEKLADFITYTALFGVMLGGRLGYMVLYQTWAFMADPLMFFRIREGGMASHGGILGIVVFTWFYARKHRVSWTGLGDMLVVGAPIGLFFGRVANFINGELWGHQSEVAWAVKFPQEAAESFALQEAWERTGAVEAITLGPGLMPQIQANEVLRTFLTEVVPARHPSQLYEALLEGVVLFLILICLRLRAPRLAHGILTGVFFISYGVLRIIGEVWRVPDHGAALWPFGMTPGQRYSALMILGGLIFWFFAVRRRSVLTEPPSTLECP